MTSQETAAEPKLHAAEPKLRTKSRPTFQTEGRGDRCQLQTKSFLKRPSLSFRKTGQATHNFPGAQGPTQVCNNYLHLQVSSNKLQTSSGQARNEEAVHWQLPSYCRKAQRSVLLPNSDDSGSRATTNSEHPKKRPESIQLRFDCHQTHCELQNGRACANPELRKRLNKEKESKQPERFG